jgi:hypothetical protein
VRTDPGDNRLAAAFSVTLCRAITRNNFSNASGMHGLAICVVFFLLCCGGTRTQYVPQNQRPEPTRIAAGNPAADDELARSARRIVREIAELRGWDPTLQVPLETAGISRMMAAIRADEESQIAPAARQAEIEFLESFGLVPERFDFERDVTLRFSQDLLGLYCFTWRRILLAANRQYAAVESSMRHELVHAFQDKYYGIAARVRWRENQGDRIAAIHSLAEGEAVCVARQLEDPRHRGCLDTNADEMESLIWGNSLDSVPPTIRYALLSPYADGMRFVQHLLRHGGWQAVDSAWRGTLDSTRELLHPGQSSSTTILAIEAPGAAEYQGPCHAEYLDILGEQGLASALFDPLNPGNAAKLAATLIGDRAGVWRCGNVSAVAWRMRFALPEHANRVAGVFLASLWHEVSEPTESSRCRQSRNGAANLVVLGRDIAIASAQRGVGKSSQDSAISCQGTEKWAGRLAGL